MSLTYVEGDLRFEFSEGWRLIESWDRHPAYAQGIKQLENGKAVDIIGVYDNRLIFFIEVKDYRLHERTKPESPWVEFELKVRNTAAGLLGAGRREQYAKAFAPFLEALLKPHKLTLVLWIEWPRFSRSADVHRKRHAVSVGVATRKLTQHVKWLDARVVSVSQEDYVRTVPGLTVKSLDRRRSQLAQDVVATLRSRGISPGEKALRHILDHEDLTDLEIWRVRATTVLTIEELFDGGW